ncbi:MAG: class I SAM-dependent methyltransferase [Sedimentitalea sp.]|uniref:class I SAM-dependent methyltransferase n=1 Tax=Sedimentitalea sp. TaxID=2048915 RepID=UPI0032630D34
MKCSGIIKGYEAAAQSLITPYEDLSCEDIYQHVMDLFPASPAQVIDIGAGSGRDAGWLASRGYSVTAVEPVPTFRAAARRLHAGKGIAWVDDRLPDLAVTRARQERFDLLLLSGVWHHLPPPQQDAAWRALVALMAPGAVTILSLRHGPGVAGRPVFPVDDDQIECCARELGLSTLRRVQTGSIQPGNRAAGLQWTWFAFRKNVAGNGSRSPRIDQAASAEIAS